ncbi:hypothetical protein BOX15_Mlig023546g3 [Macrostomum lignano]|uniref:Myosin motor domain-containing protein n=1 Tax=Macrostomum lignano TaxID=282301 RepID=A0A267G9H5_9PLAT|nr:hypothetical protein BOX15_Mlig023546g3 [Macrostomum lignano]
MATARVAKDILELGDWRSEQQLLDLMLASDDEAVRSKWCGESLLLGDQPADDSVDDGDFDATTPSNCTWYPCCNAPTLVNFYTCAKSQLYSKSDPNLLLGTRPLLIAINDSDALQQLVHMVAKDAPMLSARPLVQSSLDLVRMFTCVYRKLGDRVELDNHSVTMLHADFNENGDLISIKYDVLWLMGYGLLGRDDLEAENLTAFCFFYSLMENATESVRAAYYLDDSEIALSMACPPAYAELMSDDRLKQINVARCLAKLFEFSDENLDFIHRCAAAVLHLRLVRVVPDPRKPKKCVQFERHENLERVAQMLGLELESLMREVTVRYEVLRDGHRKALRNRTAEECNAALAGMVRAIYRRLVQFVVGRLNQRLAGGRLCENVVAGPGDGGRMTFLIGPTHLLLGQTDATDSFSSTAARDALNFEYNYLCDLLASLRSRLISSTPLLLLGEAYVKLAPEVLAPRGFAEASEAASPSAALIDSYRSLGSVKAPTLLGVAFGRGDPVAAAKKLSASATAGSADSNVFRLSKVKGGGVDQMLLEVRHWLGTRTYRLASLASLAPHEAEAASVFLIQSSQLLRQQQLLKATSTLATHSLTLLTSLLTDPDQLNLTADSSLPASVSVKLLFVDRLPSLSVPSSQALLRLRACQLAAVKACGLFQCSTSRHRLLNTFSEAVLPYTKADQLSACQASADEKCSQACVKAGPYVKRIAKRSYDGPLLLGPKLVFCHYRHLLGLYQTQAKLQSCAVLLQSHVRRLAARRLFNGLSSLAADYSRRLREAFRAPLHDGSQEDFYKAVLGSLTAEVWRENWSLIESHLPPAVGDGASLLPQAYWAELLAFGPGGRLLTKVPLSGQAVLLRCASADAGVAENDSEDVVEGPDFDQVVEIDPSDLPTSGLRGNLALFSRAADCSLQLTRLSADTPAWCWGYWDPQSVACGRRAVELGSDYPVDEPVAIFDRNEWVAHLCRCLIERQCNSRLTQLRCLVPVIVGSRSAGLLASSPLWLLVVCHAELRNLTAIGGNSLDAEVAETLANYRQFGDLEPRRRWAKVHSSQAPMQLSSLLTRLQMLDPLHKAEDEAARLRLLGNNGNGSSVSGCDSAGRRMQWAKQQANSRVE